MMPAAIVPFSKLRKLLPQSSEEASRQLNALRSRKRKVLVVDDETLLLSGIRRALRRMGYETYSAENAEAALKIVEEGVELDMILTDQRMPGMSGTELLREIKERAPNMVRVCMSGHADRPEILESINRGNVFRFLMKPWDLEEFEQTIHASIEQSDMIAENQLFHQLLHDENQNLNTERISLLTVVDEQSQALLEKTQRLDEALMETVRALAYSIEAKDAYTAGHSELVSRFAVALGEEIGLNDDDLECLRLAGILHDVGKLGVPDSVLLKPGRLTPEEFDVIRTHPEVGERILRDIKFPYKILPIVRLHHERWDGNGYPDKLAGTEIPLLARLTHIVDVYEAITARRVYRDPMPLDRVIRVFKDGMGTDFDPDLVPPFLDLLDRGVFGRIRETAECDVVQEIGEFTFRSPVPVNLRED